MTKNKKIKILIKFTITTFIIMITRLLFDINNCNQIDFIFGMIQGYNIYYWIDILEKYQK